MRMDTFSLLDVLGNKEISRKIWPGLAQVKFVFPLGIGLSASLLYCSSSFSLLSPYSSLSTLQFLLEVLQKEMKFPKTKNLIG